MSDFARRWGPPPRRPSMHKLVIEGLAPLVLILTLGWLLATNARPLAIAVSGFSAGFATAAWLLLVKVR